MAKPPPSPVTLRLITIDPVPGVFYGLCDDKNRFSGVKITGDEPFVLEILVDVRDGKFTGPFVRREGKERRFVYMTIGQGAGQHDTEWSRRAKIDVHDIPAGLVEQAIAGKVLEVTLPGRMKDGSPACATVRPLAPWKAA